MNDHITTLKLIVEASEVSDRDCAEMVTLLNQMQYYIAFKAQHGDLYAENLKKQIMKEAV